MPGEPGPSPVRGWRALLLVGAAAAIVVACNAAVGVGAVALVGGAGYVAAQCYDRVRLRVRDASTGSYTCEADVSVSDGGSERRLRPCYSAALTSGRWRFTARHPGHLPASSELVIAERDGDCPHYVHSIELTLRSENDAQQLTQIAPKKTPVPPAAAGSPAAVSPAAVSPAAVPAAAAPSPEPSAAPVPTRSFELVAPDAGAAPSP